MLQSRSATDRTRTAIAWSDAAIRMRCSMPTARRPVFRPPSRQHRMWSFASANTPPRSPALIHIARSAGGRWRPPSAASIPRGSMATRSTSNDPRAKRCCSRCYVNRVLPARLKAEGNSLAALSWAGWLPLRLQPQLDQPPDGFGAAGSVFCFAAHASIFSRNSTDARSPIIGSRPVAGRPRLFGLADIDIAEYWFSLKSSQSKVAPLAPALTPAKEDHGQGYLREYHTLPPRHPGRRRNVAGARRERCCRHRRRCPHP